jgi:hypothetical protein
MMMKRSIRTSLFTLMGGALLVGLSSTLFAIDAEPPSTLVQARQELSNMPAITENRTEPDGIHTTTTLTATHFDNAIFILALAAHPDRFVECVDNPYFPLIRGTVYDYEVETEDGLETITVTVTRQTKEVLGIPATVVRDTVLLDGELTEDTLDWFAQDRTGNVWYLGEETAEYEDGQVVSTEGSWEAGVNGALPGLIMLADPLPEDLYRQEYLKDEATDIAGVLSVSESVSVPFGDFEHVLKTADYNPLSGALEHKFYARGVGTVMEDPLDGSERTELLSVRHDGIMQTEASACGSQGEGVAFVGTVAVAQGAQNLQALAQITAGEARQVALAASPGAAVTKNQLGVRDGFLVYSVYLDDGTRRIVDAGDATLLATEDALSPQAFLPFVKS